MDEQSHGDVEQRPAEEETMRRGPNTATDRFRDDAARRQIGEESVDEERSLWQGGYSGKTMLGTWIGGAVLAIAVVVGALLIEQVPWFVGVGVAALLLVVVGALYAYRRLSVHYQLTSQRLLHQSGLLSRKTDRIEVIDIDDVSYEQGLVQRMLGVGKIHIHSSDRTHPELILAGIDSVQYVAGLIDETRRKERRRRALHIESI